MLSEKAINGTILGSEVENKVNDCLQDWAAAGSNAVREMMDRQKQADDSSKEQFIVSLIGNLAWAATVFFPPAAAAIPTLSISRGVYLPIKQIYDTTTSPSALTKVVSVLGAAVGSNTLGQLAQPNKSLDWSFVGDYLGTLVPLIAENLSTVADKWISSELTNHMIAMFSINTHPDINRSNDNDFKAWYHSYAAGRELRKTVWERFVFPVSGLEFEYGQEGMKKFLIRKLTDVKNKFDFQYKAYMLAASQSYIDYGSHFHSSRMTFEEWLRAHASFSFTVRIEGLPEQFLEAQDKRLRQMQFMLSCLDCGEKIRVPGAGLPAK
jgi:hypothetical protein